VSFNKQGFLMHVAVLGASPKPDRYAHKVLLALRQHGHEVVGINPALPDLGDIAVVPTVAALPAGIDTLTVYVGEARSQEMRSEILGYGFRRVLFNPGAENPALAAELSQAGVLAEEVCTLVLLSTGQFDD
jgi:predicted CoA-binding protein